jgi:hypothetical protein
MRANNQFVTDLESEGFQVEPYAGRYFWEGPAVRAKGEAELQAIIRATTIEVQWDTLGYGYIVYPVMDDPTWYREAVESGRYNDDWEDM